MQPANQGGRERGRGRAGSNGKPSGNWFMRHKIFTVSATAVIIALVIFAGVIANAINHPNDVLTNNRDTPPPPSENTNTATDPGESPTVGSSTGTPATSDPTPTDEQPPNYQFPKDVVNILVLGTDTGLTRTGGGRTDCIMLASINTSTKKISLISIPRDTYVKIYNDKNKQSARNRINAAFAFGGGANKNGVPYAINTVSRFLGNVPIDHYVLFNMDLVMSLINSVGGVTVDVQLSEPLDFGSVHLKPGVHKLNGYEALTYARDRHHTSGGDFGRVGHQQQVMIALLNELKNQNKVTMIPKLYQSLAKNIKTDLDLTQIAALAWIAKDVDTSSSISQYTMPGTTLTINGASLVIADQEKKVDILKEVFGTDAGLSLKVNSDETYSYLYGLIKKQFQAGQTIINNAKSLLNNNSAYFTADDAAELRSAISQWEAASKKNDADGMDDAQQDVQTQYDILSNLVQGRKALIEAGASKISWAKGKLSDLSGYMSDGDRSTVQGLINTLEGYVDSKDYNRVGAATDELVSKAGAIFDSVAPTSAPTDTPTEAPTDTPTEEPTDTPTDQPTTQATTEATTAAT